MNNKLALAIPTYNRPEILLEGLNLILDDLIKFQIPIYISDDSNNDLTRNALDAFKNNCYPHIFYKKNEPSLGHDLNCMQTIKMADTEYVWYLGDSIIIENGAIAKLLDIISTSSPAIISFYSDRPSAIDLDTQMLHGCDTVSELIAWHLTMTGTTVYHRDTVLKIDFDSSRYRNFPQLAIILETLIQFPSAGLFWLNERIVRSNPKKISYWNSRVFSVFIDDFSALFANLTTPLPLKLQEKIVTMHALETKMFTLKSLLALRSKNYFSFTLYRRYGKALEKYAGLSRFTSFLASIFPVYLLNKLKKYFI